MDVPLLDALRPDGSADPEVAELAARAWLAGGIVGLPTETVYGLAADAEDAEAVARVYQAKGRPADHPLIVHVQGAAALAGWSAGPNPAAEQLAEAFWPGALTLIVARGARAGDFVTGGQGTVALRSPNHPVAQACLASLCRISGDPARGVAAPSANRFGRVSPTRAGDVLAEVGSHLDPARDMVVDGGPCAIGVESTIVDCTAMPPRVLRLGAISQEQIDAVLAGSGPLGAGVADPSAPGAVGAGAEEARAEDVVRPAGDVRAPGTLESHYAPRANVILVESGAATPDDLVAGDGSATGGGIGLVGSLDVATPPGWTRLAAPASAQEYARDLYGALRRADELALGTVVAVLPDPAGGPLALAVRDRLTRAAHPDRA